MSQTALAAPTKRLQCGRCGRPGRACICQWITPTANEASVLILQHPLEVTQAKGSARLLQLSLQRCELIVGEALDASALQAALDAPGPDGLLFTNVLLYPDGAASPRPQALPEHPSTMRLIVLDGTWRKSLKMLHLNPALASLPRLALSAQTPSRYLIRKAHRPDQLSTLEATCLALSQIEHGAEHYTPLLSAFDKFVFAQQTFSTRIRQPTTP